MIRQPILAAAATVCIGCAANYDREPLFSPEPLATPIEVHFWLKEGKGVGDDPRILLTDGHPCGSIAVMSVESIPDDTPAIETDVYVAFDPDGRELAAWHVPVDFWVEQVRGDLVGVKGTRGHSLWIDERGRIFHRTAGSAPQTQIECPKLDRFEGSAFLRCFSTPDVVSGRERLIAWEGICT